jgi:hypothetical protein
MADSDLADVVAVRRVSAFAPTSPCAAIAPACPQFP